MNDLTLNLYIISRLTHNYYAKELKKIHVTMGQFPFLMGITQSDGISQEKLSSNMMISKSTTATVIQQLLSKKLITRTIDESDRRNFKLHATEKAFLLIPKIQEIIDRCHQEITKNLTKKEKAVFAKLTEQVKLQAIISISTKK